jgi:hypothetical protein
VKSSVSFEELCHEFLAEFVRYFHMVRSLHFSEKLVYGQFRLMFNELLMRDR